MNDTGLTTPSDGNTSPLGILHGFARSGDSKLRRTVGAVLTASAIYQLGHGWYKKGREKMTHTVTLGQDDDIYTAVHAWLLESLPSKRRKSLKVRTRRLDTGSETVPVDSSSNTMTSAKAGLNVYYDGSRACTITIAGHAVRVDVAKDDITSFKSFEDLARWKPERIVFTCQSEAARDAVLAFLKDLAEREYSQVVPRLYVADRWSGWSRMELPPRSLDTVILRSGQKERIAADLGRFLGEESAYVRLGLPWHRGYLFHGPAGTGKTSLAKALAGHFGLNLYYLPLSDVRADTNLLQLLTAIPQRSVLVLEDIDVVHAAKSRDDAESEGISLSGLLNALDGLATPHGLITVMTTNDKAALDPALIRPGRADWVEELGYLDRDQLGRLVALAFAGMKPTCGLTRDTTHAEVLEVLKRNLDNPECAVTALEAFLLGR